VERSAPLIDVSVGEILEQAIGVEPSRWTKSDQMRVGAYLKATKWERYRATSGGKHSNAREWRYRRTAKERNE
jgi:putative DNA primase/helicase